MGPSRQQQPSLAAVYGQSLNDYDNNGFVETVETRFLYAEGSVKATGCGMRLDSDSEKGALQAEALEAVIAKSMVFALSVLADACCDQASYTSMDSAVIIDAREYKELWLAHNFDNLAAGGMMLYCRTHYPGMSRLSNHNGDARICVIAGGPSNRVHLQGSACQGQRRCGF